MAYRHQMQLGGFHFSIDTAAYQSLTRRTSYRWQAQARVGREPAHQFIGPGDEDISMEGVIFPHFKGGLGQINAMRHEAGTGKPLLLVDGTGNIHDNWIIQQIEESQRLFFPDGTPRQINFRLTLKKYGDDDEV